MRSVAYCIFCTRERLTVSTPFCPKVMYVMYIRACESGLFLVIHLAGKLKMQAVFIILKHKWLLFCFIRIEQAFQLRKDWCFVKRETFKSYAKERFCAAWADDEAAVFCK